MKLILTMNLSDGVEPDDLMTDINIETLCRLEEDDKKITSWIWEAVE